MRSVVEVNTDYARQVEGKLAGIGVRCEKLQGGTFEVRSSLTARVVEDQIIAMLPNCDIRLEDTPEGCKGTVRFDGVAVMNE